ncbi:MAG: LysM peptidoglycan-binding domain-containing protein [Dysgonamonadaceae bacterium]|jgi:membrane-bound lytic murein transglycosylase D|nr:LysM peptidoglycan-binding domain-containing protein [Dysgonamonadaceae bacterium]
MKKIVLLITSIVMSCMLHAQVTLWEELKRASVQDSAYVESGTVGMTADGIYIPESLNMNVDSLLTIWNNDYFTNKHKQGSDTINPVTSDSVYANRLRSLPRIVPMTFNESVRSCIDLYADRRRDLMEYVLGWSNFYFPMIEETLDRYDLPLELKYLAVVESALNPTACSRMGASGIWQFMLPTGKIYGLEINSLVDERRDPVKSTEAACRYFKDMYTIYGDWHLVIASYNCGPGNVNKAISRAKGKRDFWQIYPYLPAETRIYVPLFIAVNYVMSYYHEHNLYPAEINLPLSTDTVIINREIHFDQIAEVMKIDKSQLRALNPQYRRDIVPGHSKPYVLQLPAAHAYGFVELEDTIASYRADELFANKVKNASSQEKIRHKVKPGESLQAIANQYGVTSAQIKRWNGMKSNKVATGRMLTIYADNGGYALNKTVGSNTSTASASSGNKTTGKSNSPIKSSGNDSYTTYKVRSGDSFYTIAKNYPGISAQDIMEFNNVSNSSLKVGQTIRIPKGV